MVNFTLHYYTTTKKKKGIKSKVPGVQFNALDQGGSPLLFELHPLLLLLAGTVLPIPEAHRALLHLWAFAQTLS